MLAPEIGRETRDIGGGKGALVKGDIYSMTETQL